MSIPPWALAISYWLHMLATVVWIGDLATITLVIIPASKSQSEMAQQATVIDKAQSRLDSLAWFSLVILLGTGLMQMSASPNYKGFLTLANQWAVAIFLKHLVFIGMTGLSAYQTWIIIPAQRRAILRQSHGQKLPEMELLHQKNVFLLRLNLILGLFVLAFTALARASL